ncbi:MAG TPA: NADH-quinone oxidoreductase subunit NuoG [Fimbriimonadaceae bacterium]|nr:NADH-quinone oxidoreductase subunit NuoG [Fimbriimonadaceae bacterium]
MAAVVGTETVKVTINEVELEVPKGELVVESVKRLGLEVPIFCYHPRLKPVGMCRMCLVEVGFRQQDGTVRKMPKPQAACTLPVSDGMVVYTDSEQVHKDRRGVLEFLLVNHPLDCPVCDRGGECPLQNNTLVYGPSTSRFLEMKRHLPKAFHLSKYVTLDLERCIQCGRCVRFTEEISGDSQLAFRFRGASMQPSTYQLTDFDSKFSGNVIEICPVGALTSAKYRFRARPWDLETKPAVCLECSNGCNVWFDHRAGRFVRIGGRTNEAVNEEWTCDKGKFGHDWYNADNRATDVLVRKGDGLAPADWPEAYSAIIENFSQGGCAALVGPKVSNEALFLLKRLFTENFKDASLDFRWNKETLDLQGLVRSPIASLESQKEIMVVGNLAAEAPIVYLRVRKAWFNNGAKVTVAHTAPTDADTFANEIVRYKSLQEIAGIPFDGVVVSTHAILDQPGGAEFVSAMRNKPNFNCFATGANTQGATELGLQHGDTTRQILEKAASGQIKALWLVGSDPLNDFHDRALAEKALENVEFLVVQDALLTQSANYASVVLPECAPNEHDGTYTNCERRVQRVSQAIAPKGDSKPAWRIFSECMVRIKPATPYFNPKEVMVEIAKRHPQFVDAQYGALEGEGVILGGVQ